MDEEINFFTDAATLALFDCSLLSHRLNDDSDWWCDSFEEIDEIKKGDISLISLGADGVYKVRITEGELNSEERDYAKMVVGPLGLRVVSGKIFVGKGECIPGEGIDCEESDIHEGEGKHISIDNGLYNLRNL